MKLTEMVPFTLDSILFQNNVHCRSCYAYIGDGVIDEEEFYRVMRKRENPLDEIDSDDDF